MATARPRLQIYIDQDLRDRLVADAKEFGLDLGKITAMALRTGLPAVEKWRRTHPEIVPLVRKYRVRKLK